MDDFFEGLDGAGEHGTGHGPDAFDSELSGTAEHNVTFSYEDAQWGPDGDVHDEHAVTAHDEGLDEPGFEAEFGTEPPGEDPADLLAGLEFDLSGLDLGSLTDTAFDAAYDLIGSDPGEQGWWTDLVSEHNADGAYATIAADDPYLAL